MSGHQKDSLPPFLKQFDPLAILEPERLAGNSAANIQRKDPNGELGSFLTLKKDPDESDLLDNLFVTPQQVSSNKRKSSFAEELSKFLDRFDAPKVDKLVDITVNETKLNEQTDKDPNASFPKAELLENEDLFEKLLLHSIGCVKAVSNIQTDVLTKDKREKLTPNIGQTFNEVNGQTFGNHGPTPHSSKIIIETVQKDPKLFVKRRIVKPEAVTSEYTKGADLYEKSVVLPQIMERLTKWKVDHDIKNNLPRKLLLDTSKTVVDKTKNSKENVTTATAIKIEPKCQCKKDKVVLNDSKIAAAGSDFKKDSKIVVDKVKIANPSASVNFPLEKLGISNSTGLKDIQRGILKASISSPDKLEPAVSKSKTVTLNPEVLMEDCNKQRLIEFTRRQLLQKFVNGEN